jgi:hypothetical protein
MKKLQLFIQSRIRFDRNELSGAFGDIGTDLPLLIGILLVTGMNGAVVFGVYGLMQIMTALVYGIPMPVQPLKMVALLIITHKLTGNVLLAGGMAIGITMLILTFSGVIDYLGRIIPKAVIRGIQMGLGLQLGMLALREYIPSDQISGYILAGAAFLIAVFLLGNRRYPPALFIVAMGAIYGLLFYFNFGAIQISADFVIPRIAVPSLEDMMAGFLILALPQIPLSLGNSIYASSQMAQDYFPHKHIPPRKIALTYSLMNIVSPLLGGIPVCHGSGGMAGHFTFGARTGGSVVIYGLLFLTIGLLFGLIGTSVFLFFPKPILGVILLFEGVALLRLMQDMTGGKKDLFTAIIVGMSAVMLPNGYLVGMILGTLIYYTFNLYSTEAPNTLYKKNR